MDYDRSCSLEENASRKVNLTLTMSLVSSVQEFEEKSQLSVEVEEFILFKPVTRKCLH
jgi:hypothetical protein